MDVYFLSLWLVLFAAIFLIVLLIRRRAMLAREKRTTSLQSSSIPPDWPIPFGYKCAWYAIRSDDPKAVAGELNLRGQKASSWQKGIEQAYDGSIFVSPSVQGWVFAVGRSLFPGNSISNAISSPLQKLSRTFGTACFFATHRVVETHIWAKAVNGRIVRAYGYSGESDEILWQEGEPTEEEAALVEPFPDEETVMDMARRWSLSPTDLPLPASQPGLGIVGNR
jgi:hypothetical protein